jgi:hypothetical protein
MSDTPDTKHALTRLATETWAAYHIRQKRELEAIERERDELRERVAELSVEWDAVHSGGNWWIAEAKTGDLIEIIAGFPNQIAASITEAHNAAIIKTKETK